MEETKVQIVSKTMIYPSSPTPYHLKHYKICLLDQLSHSFYLPYFLFYSASDISKASPTHNNDLHNFTKLSHKLKTSLSEALPIYYPFSGRIKEDNAGIPYVDCNDEGVLYLEAKIPTTFPDFLKNCDYSPNADQIKWFLPFDPYNLNPPHVNGEGPLTMAVQVSEFACGSIAIGACISHIICDGITAVSFLKVWCQKAIMGRESDEVAYPPNVEASVLFPPKERKIIDVIGETVIAEQKEKILTKRFLFTGDNLRKLRVETSRGCNFKPTRVESLTALLWKCAIDAAVIADPTHHSGSSMLLRPAVNIRNHSVPPLPHNSIGNIWQFSVSPLLEVDKVRKLGLQDVVEIVRDTIRKIDGEHVSKLQGEAKGLNEILKSMEDVLILVKKKGVPCYTFSSWASFGVFEADFGWGKPAWTCALAVPIKNIIIFMPTRSGDGIEAWITLEESHMLEFQKSPQILQFASYGDKSSPLSESHMTTYVRSLL